MRYAPVLFLLILFPACRNDGGGEEAKINTGPAAMDVAECNACGMVVRDQPAPRGQAVHRDGTRAWFCSLGDMMVYLDTPSPHGSVNHVYVELMNPDHKPENLAVQLQPWQNASEVFYVLDVERPAIMGPPVLSYKSAADADQAAQAYDGRVVDWPGLREAFGKE